VIETPEGVRAEWRGWAIMEQGDAASLRADRWRGRVALWPESASIDEGRAVTVVMPGAAFDGNDIRVSCRILGVTDSPPPPPGPSPPPSPSGPSGPSPGPSPSGPSGPSGPSPGPPPTEG
jgi:hypothetical protein